MFLNQIAQSGSAIQFHVSNISPIPAPALVRRQVLQVRCIIITIFTNITLWNVSQFFFHMWPWHWSFPDDLDVGPSQTTLTLVIPRRPWHRSFPDDLDIGPSPKTLTLVIRRRPWNWSFPDNLDIGPLQMTLTLAIPRRPGHWSFAEDLGTSHFQMTLLPVLPS